MRMQLTQKIILIFSIAILVGAFLAASIGPALVADPFRTEPSARLQGPAIASHWFGTDNLGRDVFARTIYGARISAAVGLIVVVISVTFGLVLGLLCGTLRFVDRIAMRVLDALMAIPALLLAIAMIALMNGNIITVAIAISIPEIPKVVRLVRSIVFSVRERTFVEAAVSIGNSYPTIVMRHIFPFTIAPIMVQATFIFSSAVLLEAGLSFLGAGLPPDTPTWGNMVASSRMYLQTAPWTAMFPGVFLALVVLAVNVIGDELRDRIDPREIQQL